MCWRYQGRFINGGGGPSCREFSSVSRAQGLHSMKNDKRNYVHKHYIEVLEKSTPKIFLFENVAGLLSSKSDGKNISINN